MATPRTSAGLLLWRRPAAGRGAVEVLAGHLGGPYWARKDERAWSVPKGEHGPEEEPLAAARREFVEETGQQVPDGEPAPLGSVRQSGGKVVTLWALEGDLDAEALVCNTFELEWPPGSGLMQEFPELDRFAWLDLLTAARLLVAGQVAFLDRLVEHLGGLDGQYGLDT